MSHLQGNTLDSAVRILHFQHSQILEETLLHPCQEVHLPEIYQGEEVAAPAEVEVEAESMQLHEKVQLEKEAEGVVVSLELHAEQAEEEVQAQVMVTELHSLLLRTAPQMKRVEEAAAEEEEVGLLSPGGPCPSHHLDQRYLTREFEALKQLQTTTKTQGQKHVGNQHY